MKIALFHYSAPPIIGGVESVIAHHARLMTANGHRVTIFAGRGETFDPAIPVKVFPVLDSKNPEALTVKSELDKGLLSERFYSLCDQIQELLNNELPDIDVLIAHNVTSLNKSLPLTVALFQNYRQPGFPRLIRWHHDLAWSSPRYRNELFDQYPWDLLRKKWPDTTDVVVSQARRQELAQLMGLSAENISVIPNGVDLFSFFKFNEQTIRLIRTLNLSEMDPLFLLPARLIPRKNIEFALQIMKAFIVNNPNAGLLITGPEDPHDPENALYRQNLMRMRNEMGLQNTVHFLADVTDDFLPDEIISDFYRLADALLFPSFEEGFGIPLIEAGFENIPVFCSDIPVFHEIGGENLSYFDPNGDPSAVAKMIDDRLDSEMTFRWSRNAKNNYRWESIYRSLIEPLITEERKK